MSQLTSEEIMLPIPTVDITSAAFKADPYPFYARLRSEAPVYCVTLPNKQTAWLITRYDDVTAALIDQRLLMKHSNALSGDLPVQQHWMPGFLKPLGRNLLLVDAPDHTRLRGLVHKAFTPRLIENMRHRIQSISNELLDAAQKRGQMDLIRDFALPLPVTIIAEMLGVPSQDRHKFQRWSNAIVSSTASKWGMLIFVPNMLTFLSYIRQLIQLKRVKPQDDLTSALIQAKDAEDQFNEDEMVAMIFLLLVAGHETTVNLIGNGTLALLEHRGQMEKLQNEPSLIKTAVEELLRYASPVEMASPRYAREDIPIHGVTIPRGALVHAVIASANRDERQFSNPDILDIAREPNRHVAFGQGIHYCLGAPLARLEGQIAISTILSRMPNLHLTIPAEKLHWRKGIILRGLKALPISWTS